jgi:hypothetical protein
MVRITLIESRICGINPKIPKAKFVYNSNRMNNLAMAYGGEGG